MPRRPDGEDCTNSHRAFGCIRSPVFRRLQIFLTLDSLVYPLEVDGASAFPQSLSLQFEKLKFVNDAGLGSRQQTTTVTN